MSIRKTGDGVPGVFPLAGTPDAMRYSRNAGKASARVKALAECGAIVPAVSKNRHEQTCYKCIRMKAAR